MLRRNLGFKPKRDHTNSCTPCLTLKPQIGCKDLCCRQFLVVLAQEDLDDGLLTLAPFVDVLAKLPSGTCRYFDEPTGNCRVWANRPLVCRTYDCRDDAREKQLRKVKHPADAVFEAGHPPRCTHCDRPLRLCLGIKKECDGNPVCIDCGQPYLLRFNYPDRVFRVDAISGVAALARRRYLLNCLSYREQWAEANAVLEAWCVESPRDPALQHERAMVLAELGREPEARRRLLELRPGNPSVELDLAWLDARAGNDLAAQARVESVLGELEGTALLRAHLQLGTIARRADRVEDAVRNFQKAILIDRVQPPYNLELKEYVLELIHGSDEGRARVERALL